MKATQARKIPAFLLYGETGAHGQSADRLLHVETIAARSRVNNWRIRPHLHRNLHQLMLVTRGGGEARTESTVAQFRAPTLIVVPHGTVHAFDFEPDTQGFVASIADDVLREYVQRDREILALFAAPQTLQLAASARPVADLRNAFQLFAREFASHAPGRTAALEGLLILILANVLRLSHTFGGVAGAAAGRAQWLVARFRDQVENRYRDNAALTDYAKALSVSVSRLRAACLKITAHSPMRLVYARVLLEAKRQLLYTNLSISEIAYELGFPDAAYFTRFFSNRAGLSPRAFRRQNPHGL